MKTKEKVLTSGLRETLKTIIQNEIEAIPDTLKELEPRERLNILCKLMPFVFPKVQNVSHNTGEPFTFEL